MAEDPRLAPLFASNDLPMAAQVTVIKEIVRERNATLSKVEAKISGLGSELYPVPQTMLACRRALDDEKRALRDEMHQCQGVLSPIRRIPPEILGEIFLYFAPVLVNDHYFEHHHRDPGCIRTEIPWQLGHICSYWRIVALSVRSLWTIFDLRSPPLRSDRHRSCRMTHASLDSFESRLQRSGEAPLSGRIIYRDVPHTMPIFDALWKCSHRLRHLALVDVPQIVLDQFSQYCAPSKQLCSLTLVFTTLSVRVSFECPSSLTYLHLTSIHITSATCCRIPWAQLLKYCEKDCGWDQDDDRWASYRQLSNLIELCVEFTGHARRSRSRVRLPKLRHASFTCRGTQDRMLRSFDTPVLHSLSYDHVDYAHVRVHLPHSLARLESIRIRATGFVDLKDVLEGSPDLTEIFINVKCLRLFGEGVFLDFVKPLIPLKDELPLGSKLEVVRLNADFRPHSLDKILRLIDSRAQPDSPLRELVLYDVSDRWSYTNDPEGCQKMHETSLDSMDDALTLSVRSFEQANSDFLEGHLCNQVDDWLS